MEKLAQIGTAAAPVRRAGEVGDGRLKALYAVQAGMNARDIQKNQKTDKAINKNNAVGINISLGSTGWKDLKDLQKNFFSMEP
ncbi:hypothetical protein [Dialister invisus]|uniref:hypothetical protein n=1 Tax=Dialister invisus TaxID=218538 RepID=UPI0028D2C29C|nr:hypothetical protein [Dialister invisus]